MSAIPSPDFLALQEALAGRYSLERELGRGGMGIVYLAHEVRLDRPVALKVLPPDYAARPTLRERFLREARTAARLSHPHIVPIHAVHETAGFVFFVMAYVEGGTLGERIRRNGPLPPRDAARVLREVGWALAYAHGQGVVHRDVKPDNILLEAGSGRALVTDFGIARVAAEAGLTGEEIAGTVEFMSPEQASGRTVDSRSDLYSLGVIGQYALSGRLPFQGADAATTLAMQMTQAPPVTASIVPGVPDRLAQAIDRCLAKDPDKRFADGEEFAASLSQVLQERRDVPVALRLFMKQSRESTGALMALQALSVFGLVMAAGGFFDDVELWWVLLTGGVSLALAALPASVLVRLARRLLHSGYDHDDLIRAMREEVSQAREDLFSVYASEPSRIDRWLKRLVPAGLGVIAAAFGWIMLGPFVPGFSPFVGLAMIAATILTIGTGATAALRHQLRDHVPGRGWLGFWESPLGRGLFSVSRLGVDPVPNGPAYGPTELSIGSAADHLFEALPPEQREVFRELPEVVRRLEADAEHVRGRLRQLDDLAGRVHLQERPGHEGEPPTARATDRPDSLAEDLARARAAAEDRLREIVAALETIRIELLRLHAGAGSVASITMDLNAARELSADVARMLAARDEVERILASPGESRPGVLRTPG